MLLRLLTFCLTLLLPGAAGAAAPVARVRFRDDVLPLLRARCLRCHQGSNPSSGVRLDARGELLGESNGQALVIPGAAAASRLVHLVTGAVPDRLMPPDGRGTRLTPAEVAVLRAWIDQGLTWDDAALPPPTPPEHWAFRRLRRPPVPRVPAPWPLRTPVDAFLAAAWLEKGVQPVAEAPRRTLLRRLSLDLLGLPPTAEQVAAFEADPAPDAYDRQLDRLLASPRYGERWGRYWLDLARHADSEGYESNHPRPHAWRYRDWVADSFNRDRPFAAFTRLQLAGDEVRPYRDDNLVATGFLTAARLSSNEEDKPRQRNDLLVDVVNTTASAFLGLTVGCAQCHNHKFDPITARDYYRLQAFFITGQPANVALRDPVVQARYRAGLPARYEAAWRRRQDIYEQARQAHVARVLAGLPEAERSAHAVPADRRTDEQERRARLADLKVQATPAGIERSVPPERRREYDDLKRKLAAWDRGAPEAPQALAFTAPATAAAEPQVLPMLGFYPLPYEPERLGRMRARLLVGGDVHRWGAAVDPGWPAVFGPTPRQLTPTPRQALAAWLTDPANPLTARVWVNRVWGWHFGTGLVATASDFGVKGKPPTHPELLDWLAAEFLTGGGSTKHLHRLLLRSTAYRLATTEHAGNAALDPDNRLRWRWTARRLEAEAVRDCLLAVSGELSPVLGGPPDADERASLRRGLYLLQKRDAPPMLQGLFDGPVASAESCPRRGVSTVPLQALYLLNNAFVGDRAAAVAARVSAAAADDRDRQIDAAFRLVLARPAEAEERAAARRFFLRHGDDGALQSFCQALLNVNEFLYLE